ncbi:vacuolar protein sorting/targeting protein PEP1 [Penicillium riverlandense]|uniref:vacuolar protein sorting/targeting protein PEP1 n=1 Tax=Penicillium riverlandense TaxID=1903569 RepID=UPI002549142B|nr:vacuolar protein sorting/targeting protein PEP1 [Penicillium riverlandense]KAJ5808952.1 vacuolar protein sorting/targeting protein PEP1 [Penicillium riverlandense]
MTPRWLLFMLSLLLADTFQSAAAKDYKPNVSPKEFDGPPGALFYFEGTETIVLYEMKKNDLYTSFDGGKSWGKPEEKGMAGAILTISPHPFDDHCAYALGKDGQHWVTTDQAKTWQSFDAPVLPGREPLNFNSHDSNKVIFRGEECLFPGLCQPITLYTTDNFKTKPKLLRERTDWCMWAASTREFGQNVDVPSSIKTRILCLVPPLKRGNGERLVYTDDFFHDGEGTEVKLKEGQTVSGVGDIGSVRKYLVALVQSRGTDEKALFVSDDSVMWHRAEFDGHRLEEDGFTLLESTEYSMQVDVLDSTNYGSMGVLFTSNSNGTYFTRNIEHTNRFDGWVDFEKVADIQGIVIVNTVENWKDVEGSETKKKDVVSSISFDDGRTFQDLKVGKETLHLHSMTSYRQLGKTVNRIFSSPAPGLVMGVGNTGKHLKKYDDGDTFVSDDGGLTWLKALEGPHLYAFGDQGGVIIAIPDEKTDKVQFSINHGKDWEHIKLDHKIAPISLKTTPDSTSLIFVLIALATDEDQRPMVYSIDFDGLHERKCDPDDDFEDWVARLDENGEPDCVMGQVQTFRRRKSDADCFVKEPFSKQNATFTPCECTKEDFECDYNFVRSGDGESCIPTMSLKPPAGKCKDSNDKYKGPSGWRLIPGNGCKGGEDLEGEVSRSCGNFTDTPIPDGEVASYEQELPAKWKQYFYLERQASNSGSDETIVMLTEKGELYISHDHGQNWERPLKSQQITQIIRHPHHNEAAFFLTDSETVYYTYDRGLSEIKKFEAPLPPTRENGLLPLSFHEHNKNWLMWTGHAGGRDSDSYYSSAYISKHRGEGEWTFLLESVGRCEFVSREIGKEPKERILCGQYENENKLKQNQQLLSSDDGFEKEPTVLFNNITGFALMDEFIVVASFSPNDPKYLNASSSLDGEIFAPAHFPFNLDVPAYTVLSSSTHAIFLHVTVNEGAGYGPLVKSNSNGTSFVLSLNAINRDQAGYVDFERMAGLEGVAVVNVVANVDDVEKKGTSKKLRSMITHNDGAEWALLAPPTKDADGKKFKCSVREGEGTDDCALHLHSFTERSDPRDTFSSPSAIGMMIGLGNVGDHLTDKDEADTFITTDGGITWKCAKKGRYRWEYGAAGSVIVLVPEGKAATIGYYSLDEGNSWKEFTFSNEDMTIDEITTVPSDVSRRFLLWGKSSKSGTYKTVSLDFDALRDRTCDLDEEGGKSDYILWTPKHPAQEDNCLFGHVEQYHRKDPKANCWNTWRDPHVHSIGKNCTCTRSDFECDYNYELQKDGSCALVPGLPKPDHSEQCKQDDDLVEYWEPTGYRRIPLTTCEGGKQYDQFVSHPCPDKEEEYRKKHGIGGVGLFFAIVVPFAAAAAAGYYVYTRWDGKFGQIRLGDATSSSRGLFSRDSVLIKVPVVIIAGVVAVAQALPLLVMSLWRSGTGYMRARSRGYQRPYSTRGSFAARRGDYTHVVDDEDELLGVDEEDEDEA